MPSYSKNRMYNATNLKAGLIGLVGWRQNADSSGTQLTGLTTSTSGMYYNDIHPYLTIDNLLSVAPDFEKTEANQDDINTAFTNWLQEKTEAGIIQAVNTWLNRKSEMLTASALLESTQIYQGTGRQLSDTKVAGKLAGLEITPYRSRLVNIEVESIGIQLTANQSITVYLFHTGSTSPVESAVINYTANGGVQWENVNWTLNGEGAYYICYQQDDLTGTSLNGTYDEINTHSAQYIAKGKYFYATPFTVTSGIASLWDFTDNKYSYSTNYGLNIRSSVKCDYTDFVLQQKSLFQTAIANQVAVNLIKEMQNPQARINRNTANITKEDVLFALHGANGNKDGLLHELKRSIDSIQFDSNKIDKVCMPCRRRRVRYTST